MRDGWGSVGESPGGRMHDCSVVVQGIRVRVPRALDVACPAAGVSMRGGGGASTREQQRRPPRASPCCTQTARRPGTGLRTRHGNERGTSISDTARGATHARTKLSPHARGAAEHTSALRHVPASRALCAARGADCNPGAASGLAGANRVRLRHVVPRVLPAGLDRSRRRTPHAHVPRQTVLGHWGAAARIRTGAGTKHVPAAPLSLPAAGSAFMPPTERVLPSS